MRRVLAAALAAAALSACTPPPGWTHYVTARGDGRDAYQLNVEGTDRTIWAVIFTEGHPTFIDCTAVDC